MLINGMKFNRNDRVLLVLVEISVIASSVSQDFFSFEQSHEMKSRCYCFKTRKLVHSVRNTFLAGVTSSNFHNDKS